jgi:hypothetical protein
MSEKEIHLHVPESAVQYGKITLVHRDGQALPEIQMKKVRSKTTIYGPREYISKVYAEVIAKRNASEAPADTWDVMPGIMSYKADEANSVYYIRFDEFPDHPINGAVIDGNMVVNPELEGWRLNSGDFMTPDFAVDFIRKRAHHFGSVKEAQDLISLLRNIEVTFETTKKTADDGRGKIENALNDQLLFKRNELPKDMRITLPIFNGCPSVTLHLEIELKRKGHDPALAFYCLELETMKREQAKAIMEEELAPFAGLFVQLQEI